MDQNKIGAEWISEFLEWTFTESDRDPAQLIATEDTLFAIEAAGEIAAAYLEWIDVSPFAAAAVRSPFGFDRRGLGSDSRDISREGVLLMALRAEADCVHVLRQVLDADGADSGNLQLAIEELDQAQRMLEVEQRAWHALAKAPGAGWTTPQSLRSTGFDREWPSALENVAAEVRALAGKILSMHPH